MEKHYLDTYVLSADAQITLGNDCMELGISIHDNHPITEYVLDKTTVRRWEAADGRRLIQGGAVSIDDVEVTDPNFTVTPERLPLTLKSGKKNFRRLAVKG